MKKILSIFLVLSLLMFSAVACSNVKDNNDNANNNEQTNNEQGDNGSSEENQEAKLEDKLIIYSTHSEAMIQVVADAFTEKTGVQVEFINLKGELADRVRAEKENPQADIMFGGASSLFMDMTKEGIFMPVETTWANDLDPMFKDADNHWFGTIQTPVMLFYNTEMLSEEEAPKDWADLADAKYKDLIVSRDTGSSSIKSTLMSLVYQYHSNNELGKAWDYLTSFDNNIKNYYSSQTLQFQAVGRKEAAISFATQSAIVDAIGASNMPLKIVDATSGSPVITDGIAAINNAPHPNAAKAFVEFAGSAEMQAKLANEFNRIPTLKAAIANSPEWMQESYKAMNVDWSVISENESDWLQKFDAEIRDASKDKAE